jgi:hypothetical protein
MRFSLLTLFLISALILAFVATFFVERGRASKSSANSADWSIFQLDLFHSRCTNSTGPLMNAVLWKLQSGNSTPPPSLTPTSTTLPTPAPVSQPLSELLPARNDVDTKWVDGGTQGMVLNATGFLEGVGQSFYLTGLQQETVVNEIYRFSSSNSAGNYYNNVVESVKDTGGYNKVSTASLGIVSYGTDTLDSLGIGAVTTIYGVESNICFKVTVSSFLSYTEYDALQFAKIIADKIVALAPSLFPTQPSPSILEFPVTSILVLIAVSAVAEALVFRRKFGHKK